MGGQASLSSIIELNEIRYQYPSGAFSFQLDSLAIAAGERLAITGASGCGKTTLLRLITGLLDPCSGSVHVSGREMAALSDTQRRALRIQSIGSIAQELDLLDYLPVEENILLPFFINGAVTLTAEVRRECLRLSDQLGLAGKLGRFPAHLSQGERQRVAICRALITQPEILIADEPTGNLDESTARTVLDLIGQVISERGTTFLMVTHDRSLLEFFNRHLDLDNDV